MKRNPSPLMLMTAAAFCLAGVLHSSPARSIGKPYVSYSMNGNEEPKEEPAKKNKTKSANTSSRNNSSVKIYPDVIKRDMHVVAKDNDGKQIEFFVFDLEGTLIQNYKMKAKDHVRMTGLSRGKYQYRVFCGDEETAAGHFEIR